MPGLRPRLRQSEPLKDTEHRLRLILPGRLRNQEGAPRLAVAVVVQEDTKLSQEGVARRLLLQRLPQLGGLVVREGLGESGVGPYARRHLLESVVRLQHLGLD